MSSPHQCGVDISSVQAKNGVIGLGDLPFLWRADNPAFRQPSWSLHGPLEAIDDRLSPEPAGSGWERRGVVFGTEGYFDGQFKLVRHVVHGWRLNCFPDAAANRSGNG